MSTKFEHIRSFWGKSLQRISPEVLRTIPLSPDTKFFLTEIGLPTETRIHLKHALEVNFYFSHEQISGKTYQGKQYCVIGDDLGTTFAISMHDNAIYSIDFNNELPDPYCFVNSSIWQFLECLQIFSEFQQAASGGEDERQMVEKMRERFSATDPDCLTQPGTWWSIIINQPY